MDFKLGYIAERLRLYPPCPYFVKERFEIFKEIDRIFMNGSLTSKGGDFDIGGENRRVKVNPIKDLYVHQMDKALSEIATCKVGKGMVVWQLYNMGYIVKTPTITIGFDVVRGLRRHNWEWEIPGEILSKLARCMDVLFVTHYIDRYHTHPSSTWLHADHCDEEIVKLMQRDGKPVFIPTGHETYFNYSEKFIYAGHHQSFDLLGMHITSYGGSHVYQDNPFETPLMVYEVINKEGKKIFFTGDLDYTSGSAVPYKDNIDILFLRCGGISPLYDDRNPYDLGDDEDAFYLGLQEFKTKIAIAGHLAEMSHPPGGGRESYLMAFDIFSQLAGKINIKYLIMFWGEKFYCDV